MYLQVIQELTSLISIRQFVVNAVEFTPDKNTSRELEGIRLLLDKKIISILIGKDFKDFVGYDKVQEAKQEAANLNNIFAGTKGRK